MQSRQLYPQHANRIDLVIHCILTGSLNTMLSIIVYIDELSQKIARLSTKILEKIRFLRRQSL